MLFKHKNAIFSIFIFLLIFTFSPNVKADFFLADNRFTPEAQASDYSQCQAINTVMMSAWKATKVGMKAGGKAITLEK